MNQDSSMDVCDEKNSEEGNQAETAKGADGLATTVDFDDDENINMKAIDDSLLLIQQTLPIPKPLPTLSETPPIPSKGLLTKMLANLPVEIILLICQYPEFKDLGQLAWTNSRMMRIIRRYLPILLERKTLLYRPDPLEWRECAYVAYFKDKLYYLGGWDPKKKEDTNRVDLLMIGNGKAEKYIDYQTMNGNGLKLERFQKDDFISELHR
ncbi:hypothetical protein WR25_05935 [Diploscapter pachys]|uniref:F-box domain-containing protein n=1 Tax=Diploscapter pachys TaxID=2018661 RepID=A0A2A2L5Q0_9BILA|nr:hypothetical protein WR25_05935 [Diploscapter pachys]